LLQNAKPITAILPLKAPWTNMPQSPLSGINIRLIGTDNTNNNNVMGMATIKGRPMEKLSKSAR